jgi:uncharacterized protein
MRLGRLPLSEPKIQRQLLIGGTIIASLAIVPGHFVGDPELRELFGTTPMPPTPFYILAGCGSSAAVIGGVLLLTPLLDRLRCSPWLTAPGRQSLTLYMAHILIGMGVIEAMGWMDGSLSPAQVFWLSIGFCVLSSLYARLWAINFRRGPLETAMRWMTEARA